MSPEEMDEFERLWKADVPMSEMTRRLGYSDSYLNAVATHNRERFPYRHVPAVHRREVGVAMLMDGVPAVEVAKTLKVSLSTVYRWKRWMP